MIDNREITPELLARLAVVLFKRISIKNVLEDRIRFDQLSAKDLARLMLEDSFFNQSQSMDSCESLAHSVIDFVTQKTRWQIGSQEEYPNRLNVFDLLVLTLQDLLVMNQNWMEFRYEEIFSWRTIVRYLGEELALSIRYAQWDFEHQKAMRKRYDEFTWPYVTRHNNKQLNLLIQRGVSEHHCHLWGSTPYFHVSWINLMNDLTNSVYQDNLRKLNPSPWSAEAVRRHRQGDDDEDAKEYFGELAQTRAAWIRFYLCKRLTKTTVSEKERACLRNVHRYDNWRMLLMSRNALQAELDSYAHLLENGIDYALTFASLQKSAFSQDYQILIGERWLYYRIFRDYCKPAHQRILSLDDYNLFFAYFLIRLKIREKMVQNNDNIGFDNFQRIQNRKNYFLGDLKSERALTRLSINDTLKKHYVNELEVRITPNAAQVKRLEAAVNSESREDPVNRFLKKHVKNEFILKSDRIEVSNRYYYVFHFIKQRDPLQEQDSSYERSLKIGRICRHSRQRQFYLEQAKSIIQFREEQPELAGRVLGIDAASQELGCRPEVFGTVYRLLGGHQFHYGGYTKDMQALPMLGKTFHVGEDFFDIVDGLRAIDEVISFLDFDCGDRLGHALALGIDVEDWYAKKNYEVSISIQDYLDNLAWLYHALNSNAIQGFGSLKERIIQDFEYWFRIVYRNSIKEEHISNLIKSAIANWYNITKEDHGRYHEHTCHFDIIAYYQAWMLRGDDPSCYIDGYFKKPSGGARMLLDEKAKVCTNFPPRYENRYIPEYSLLNYLYQFNDQVRKEGLRKITVVLSKEYVHAVKAVQIAMRYRIARKGIAIETNPTSNVLIGTFRKYEKHPILAFYNRGLSVNNTEEQECAQLQVSINTDDSGVFYTDLETEYALLARSVEKLVNKENQLRFKKADIYAWLDNIRVMGNEETFRYQNRMT